MHTDLKFVFKRALHFGTLAIMQHYEPASFQMLHHQYDTPTLKLTHFILLVMKGS